MACGGTLVPEVPVRILRLLMAFILVLVVAFLSMAASFGIGRGLDALQQARRMSTLRKAGPSPAAAIPDPQIPGNTPLDRIQVVATHNSYHLRAGPLQYFLIGLVKPGEPAKLRYQHEPIYDQLSGGVRGLELDVRNRGRRLVVSHVPMVDNRSTSPDLGLALEEIRLWSSRHPEHVPLTVLLELKEDWGFLDPRLRPWDTRALEHLDTLIRKVFPPTALILPADLSPDTWPTLDQVRGRVLFVLHVDARITDLYGGDVLWRSGSGDPAARVQILNDPTVDGPAIAAALRRRNLVRTRADADLVRDPARLGAALTSGAQIISTDYPGAGGVAFAGGTMIRVQRPGP
jgi:hypothetical protein